MSVKKLTYAEWLQTFERETGLARSLLGVFSPIDIDDGVDGYVFIGSTDGAMYSYSTFAALTEAGVAPSDFETVLAAAKANRSWWQTYGDMMSYDDERAPEMVKRGLAALGEARVGRKGKPPVAMVVSDYDSLRDRSLSGRFPEQVGHFAIAIYPAVQSSQAASSVSAPQPKKEETMPAAQKDVVEVTTSAPEKKKTKSERAPAAHLQHPAEGTVVLVRLGRSGVVLGALGEGALKGFAAAVSEYLADRFIDWSPDEDRIFSVSGYAGISLPDWVSEQLPFSEFIRRPEGMSASAVVPIRVQLPLDGADVDYLEPGLGVVVAPTGWGKSIFLLRGLKPAFEAAGHHVRVISYNEPIEQATIAANADVLYEPNHLLVRVAAWLLDERPSVLMVDSLRAFVYSKSAGGTGTKGFDQLLFTQLTALSNAALVAGRLGIFSLNPLVDDEDEARVKEIHDGIRASVTTAMLGRNQPLRSLSVERRGLTNTDRTALTGTVKSLLSAGARLMTGGIQIEDPTPESVPEQFVMPHLARLVNLS